MRKNNICLGKLFKALLLLNLACFSQQMYAQSAPGKQWDKTFGGSSEDYIICMQQTSDGGYILGGSSNSPISGDKSQAHYGFYDYWVVKLDASGNKVWDKTFGGNIDEQLGSIQQTSDGGYILGGFSNSGISGNKSLPSKGNYDYWVIKLDANGNKVWERAIGGRDDERLTCIQLTSDGGYALGGWSKSEISGDKSQSCRGGFDYWLVKLDANGSKAWDKTLGGGNRDWLNSFQQTADGGFILGGYSESDISGDKTQASKGSSDYWVVKLDNAGNKVWDKTLGGSNEDILESLQQTSDGGYILGGGSNSGVSSDKSQASKGSSDYWVVKLDAAGNKSWDKSLGGSFDDWLISLQQTSDGGYILGGGASSGVSGDKSQASMGGGDYWILKLDAAGNKVWDKTIGGSGDDALFSVRQTSDGGFALGGYSDSPISGDKSQATQWYADYWVVKLGPETVTGMAKAERRIDIEVFPNPNQGRFKLLLSGLSQSDVSILVTDLKGRKVMTHELNVLDRNVPAEIDLPVNKGIYILQVKTDEQAYVRRIVIE